MVMMLRRVAYVAVATGMVLSLGSSTAADLNPAALAYKLPNQVTWSTEANGAQQAVLAGPVRGADKVDGTSHEPPAFSSQRPVHYGDLGDMVGGDGQQVRSGEHGAHAARDLRQTLWQADPL